MASSSSSTYAVDTSRDVASAHDHGTAVLDALGDPVSREILTAGRDGTVTVDELAARCEVSESTVYRRLDRLSDLDLVERDNLVSKGAYRTTMDGLCVRPSGEGFDVERAADDDFADAMAIVLGALDVKHVEYDAEGRTVDVRFGLDEEAFRTFLGVYARE